MPDTAPSVTKFQAGHTYTRTVPSGATEQFRVEQITYQPGTGAAFAAGWKGGLGAWYGRLVPVTDCLGWTDTGPTHDTAPSRPEILNEAADTAQGVADRLHREGHTDRAQGAYDVMDVLRQQARTATREPS